MQRHLLRTHGFRQVLGLLLLLGLYAAHDARAGQSDVETESAKTWVGKKVIAFTLPNTDGKPVNITRNLRRHPVVLVFYRGVW